MQKRKPIPVWKLLFYLCKDPFVYLVLGVEALSVICIAYFCEQFEPKQNWDWNRFAVSKFLLNKQQELDGTYKIIYFFFFCCSFKSVSSLKDFVVFWVFRVLINRHSLLLVLDFIFFCLFLWFFLPSSIPKFCKFTQIHFVMLKCKPFRKLLLKISHWLGINLRIEKLNYKIRQ